MLHKTGYGENAEVIACTNTALVKLRISSSILEWWSRGQRSCSLYVTTCTRSVSAFKLLLGHGNSNPKEPFTRTHPVALTTSSDFSATDVSSEGTVNEVGTHAVKGNK